MVEKVVRSLEDLEDALRLAARDGGCRIRVGDRVAALMAEDSLSDDEAERLLSHPEVTRRLDSATRALEEGRGISHQDLVQRLGRR